MAQDNQRTLDEQRLEYKQRRFVAMPLAGMLVWTGIGLAGAFLSPFLAVWSVWIGAGSIFYVGVLISRFTGENLLDKTRPKNTFDTLFLQTALMAMLVFAIAAPFANLDYTSIPLTVGILTGLMWVPLSWALEHWVGIFHGVGRTLLVVTAWYVFPEQRFVAIPAVIVIMYAVTIPVLEQRWRKARCA